MKRSRSAPRPTASAAAASSALTFNGPTPERRDDGNQPGGESLLDRRRARGKRRADEPELRHLHRVEADLVAEEGHRAWADRCADPVVDIGERLPDDRERVGARHAPSLDEAHLEAGALQLGRDLRARAVNDADVVPLR